MTKLLTLRGRVNRPGRGYEVTKDCLGQSILLGQHFQYPDKATFSSGTYLLVAAGEKMSLNTSPAQSGKSFSRHNRGMISQARAGTQAGPFRINSQKNSCLLNCFIAKSRDGVCKCIGHLQSKVRQCHSVIKQILSFFFSESFIILAQVSLGSLLGLSQVSLGPFS